jgi:hypothetical protein
VPRPIPFSTQNQSNSARSPFYKAAKAKHGKAVSKGMKRAAEERNLREAGDIADAVTRKK